jgi:tetratricopeptide (TPR) repeat protein
MRILRVAMWIVLLGAGCAVGVLIGISVERESDQPLPQLPQQHQFQPQQFDAKVVVTPSDDPESQADVLQGLSIQQTIQRGDTLLRDADVIGAAALFEELKNCHSDRLTDDVRYRLAICAEAIGDHDKAIAEYLRVADQPASKSLGLAARLGRARMWIRSGRPEMAKSILCTLRVTADQRHSNVGTNAEIAHLLASAHANEVHQRMSDDLLSDKTIVAPGWNWYPEDGLNTIVNLDSSRQEGAEVVEGTVKILHRFGNAPEDIQVSAVIERQDLLRVVERLVSTTRVTCKWSDPARTIAAARSAEVMLKSASLADILDDLLDSIGLVWSVSYSNLAIRSAQEVLEQDLSKYKLAVGERAARYAITRFPDHTQATTSYLALANMAFVHQRWSDAESLYEQALRLYPRSTFRCETWFNYAKTLLHNGKTEAAQIAFLRVADEGRGHPLEAIAYLYVGRLALDTCNFADAVSPLSRSVAIMKDDDRLPAAVITLASAYVMDDRQSAAISLLMNHRKSLDEDPFRNPAAFVTATARYHSAVGEAESIRAGRDLVRAMASVVPSDFFGHYGYLMLANAFEQLGLFDEMEATYQQALKAHATKPLHDRIRFQLAEHRQKTGKTNAARRDMQLLADEAEPQWRRRARLALADMDFREGHTEHCLAKCRALIAESQTKSEQSQALRLMGHVYERREDYYRAAICFAGMLPQTVNDHKEAH